jgi:hypothetical protein
LTDCCTKSFGWQVEDCVAKGLRLESQQQEEQEEQEFNYVPDWTSRTCSNDKPPLNEWTDQYSTLKECCTANFEWILKDCLGETIDDDDSGLDPDKTYWYPIFTSTKCMIHTDENPAPSYMIQNADSDLYPTFKECCQSNFPQKISECKSSSRLDTPPTRPPATDTTLVVVPVSLTKYYYPRYTENQCLLNGEEAPGYMKKDPVTYMSLSMEECCRVQFPLNSDDCLYNSGYYGEQEGEFNEERWKDHYYPLFSKVGCINDNEYDVYMTESPYDFFFTTMELCCGSDNFDSGDYELCLGNSVNVLTLPNDGEMEEQSSQVDRKTPFLVLDFGGRLYFQNVFIPSGNRRNMMTVRDAILFAIESIFQGGEFKVEGAVGKNFDGIDLTGLDRRWLGEEAFPLELTMVDREFQDQEERGLGKMQLFSFVIKFTVDCGSVCGQDSKMYGRQESLKIAELFDDAVQDGRLFTTLKTSMDEQGLIGPFYSASLNDGVLLYETSTMDMNGSTFSPTRQPSLRPSSQPSDEPSLMPSESPTLHPTKSPTRFPTLHPIKSPTGRPTVSSSPTETVVYQFYPVSPSLQLESLYIFFHRSLNDP